VFPRPLRLIIRPSRREIAVLASTGFAGSPVSATRLAMPFDCTPGALGHKGGYDAIVVAVEDGGCGDPEF
jgi:hypothetical protein